MAIPSCLPGVGWHDGRTESFARTEVDRSLSGGLQSSGAHWGRSQDHLGIAVAVDGLSPDHREYLAHGGSGFVLGDGALHYGLERIAEAYYSLALFKQLTLGPDFQLFGTPDTTAPVARCTLFLCAHLEF